MVEVKTWASLTKIFYKSNFLCLNIFQMKLFKNNYSVFHRFRQDKFAYSGSILSSSQFLLLPQLPQKMELASKVVKVDSKIIISLPKIYIHETHCSILNPVFTFLFFLDFLTDFLPTIRVVRWNSRIRTTKEIELDKKTKFLSSKYFINLSKISTINIWV